MKRVLLSAFVAVCTLQLAAQPQGGFGGFGGFQQQAKLETSQEWKDVNYAGDDKAFHTCDIYLPKQEKASYPVVIHIYGSAWFSNNSKGQADLGTIVNALLKAGYAVVCPNHRSSMDAKWPAQIHDIRAVIRFVRGEAAKYKFDTSFIATSGFSSGGHLSSVAATTSGMKQTKVGTVDIDLEGNVGNYLSQPSTVNAACDWSGPVDLTAMDCGEGMKMGENSPEDVLLNSKLAKEPDKYKSLSATYYVNKNNRRLPASRPRPHSCPRAATAWACTPRRISRRWSASSTPPGPVARLPASKSRRSSRTAAQGPRRPS